MQPLPAETDLGQAKVVFKKMSTGMSFFKTQQQPAIKIRLTVHPPW